VRALHHLYNFCCRLGAPLPIERMRAFKDTVSDKFAPCFRRNAQVDRDSTLQVVNVALNLAGLARGGSVAGSEAE
jgi:hypothetical protein